MSSDYAAIELEGVIKTQPVAQGAGLFVLVQVKQGENLVVYRVVVDDPNSLDGFSPGDRLHVVGKLLRVNSVGQLMVKAGVAQTPAS